MLPLHIAGLVLDPLVLIGLLALFVREESNREVPRVLAIAWGAAVIGVCMASWSDSSDWDRANWLALGITAGALGALTHTISLAPRFAKWAKFHLSSMDVGKYMHSLI